MNPDTAAAAGSPQPRLPDRTRGAARSELPPAELEQILRRLGDLERDEHGRIVGFGLSLRPTAHRLLIAGRELYAWCAMDALVFPTLLEVDLRVHSTCAATGAPSS
jgi:alkylmercury lyase